MEKDAVSAGVSEVGGLFNTAEIRILVCYVISSVDQPVPGQLLANVLHYEGIANVFEVSDAIAALVESGHIIPFENETDTYVITPTGKSSAETLKTTLSYSVKDRAYSATLKMLSQFKNAKESDIDISHIDGKTFITCSAKDNGQPFVSVKLLVSDEEQALYIKNKFLNDSNIYSEIIDLLTK